MEKRLYRSRKWRVFGGVAGGLAEYFNLDPILIRVIFVIVTIFHGIGILIYIVLWIVLPEVPFEVAYQYKPDEQKDAATSTDTNEVKYESKKRGSGRVIAGVILISIGILFLFDRIIPSFDFADIFPVALIVIGIALIWNSVINK